MSMFVSYTHSVTENTVISLSVSLCLSQSIQKNLEVQVFSDSSQVSGSDSSLNF